MSRNSRRRAARARRAAANATVAGPPNATVAGPPIEAGEVPTTPGAATATRGARERFAEALRKSAKLQGYSEVSDSVLEKHFKEIINGLRRGKLDKNALRALEKLGSRSVITDIGVGNAIQAIEAGGTRGWFWNFVAKGLNELSYGKIAAGGVELPAELRDTVRTLTPSAEIIASKTGKAITPEAAAAARKAVDGLVSAMEKEGVAGFGKVATALGTWGGRAGRGVGMLAGTPLTAGLLAYEGWKESPWKREERAAKIRESGMTRQGMPVQDPEELAKVRLAQRQLIDLNRAHSTRNEGGLMDQITEEMVSLSTFGKSMPRGTVRIGGQGSQSTQTNTKLMDVLMHQLFREVSQPW